MSTRSYSKFKFDHEQNPTLIFSKLRQSPLDYSQIVTIFQPSSLLVSSTHRVFDPCSIFLISDRRHSWNARHIFNNVFSKASLLQFHFCPCLMVSLARVWLWAREVIVRVTGTCVIYTYPSSSGVSACIQGTWPFACRFINLTIRPAARH